MSARAFSHPGFGKEARVEQDGCEVRLVFVANTEAQASDLADKLLAGLAAGGLNLSFMGKPTSVTQTR
jgi:hypothetical protein